MTPQTSKQIDETMIALDQIERINAPEGFLDSVMNRVDRRVTTVRSFSASTVISMAAAFALLISLNIFSWVNYHSSTQTITPGVTAQSVADDYGFTNSTYNY